MGSRLNDLVTSISNVKSRKQFDILVQLYLDVLPPLSVKVTSAGPMDVNDAQGIIIRRLVVGWRPFQKRTLPVISTLHLDHFMTGLSTIQDSLYTRHRNPGNLPGRMDLSAPAPVEGNSGTGGSGIRCLGRG